MGKSRVFAYRSEIDEWWEKRSHSLSIQNASQRPRIIGRVLPVALPLVFLGLTAYFFILKRPSRDPEDFRIEGSELVVVNDKGRELWRYDTGKESFYALTLRAPNSGDSGEGGNSITVAVRIRTITASIGF